MDEESGEINQLFVYEEQASRLELFIRILYWIAIGIVLAVYQFVTEICLLIQWFVILIFGRRNEGLSNFIKGYLEYVVQVLPYITFMTDRRAEILPNPVRIYIKKINK